MKKKLAVMLCAAMTIASLAGCGQSAQPAESQKEAQAEAVQEQEETNEEAEPEEQPYLENNVIDITL